MRNYLAIKPHTEEPSGGRGQGGEKAQKTVSSRDWRIMREDNGIRVRGSNCPNPFREWSDLNGVFSLGIPKEVQHNLEDNGYTHPTPIQMQAIPIGLKMRDMIGLAPTGSGKSAAFLLPIIAFLNRLPRLSESHLVSDGPYAMIMAPTRELAQ